MRCARRWTVMVLLLTTATSARSQQTPRFELTPDNVLTDEAFRMAVTGLKPDQDVTIRADGGAAPGTRARRSAPTRQAA